jgi:hypothetical protein
MVEEGEKVLKLGLTGEHINNPQSVYGSVCFFISF